MRAPWMLTRYACPPFHPFSLPPSSRWHLPVASRFASFPRLGRVGTRSSRRSRTSSRTSLRTKLAFWTPSSRRWPRVTDAEPRARLPAKFVGAQERSELGAANGSTASDQRSDAVPSRAVLSAPPGVEGPRGRCLFFLLFFK